MRELDARMFESINAAGGTNASYPWVEACIRLMRPAVSVIVLGVWAITHLDTGTSPVFQVESVDNFAAAIGFYLFGDRTLFYAKRGTINK